MSYEGYTQYLCAKGHYFMRDAYDYSDVVCDICSNGAVWWNQVDETNGSHDDDGNRIDGYVELEEKPATYVLIGAHHPCPTCGHTESYPKTYIFPSKDVGHHEVVPIKNTPYPQE